MDYELERCTRRCTASGRELLPGETIYSALTAEGSKLVRHDFAAEAWPGPPEGVLGWWKSQIPTRESKRRQGIPNDVMLDLVAELEDRPEQQDLRYVLSLLLVRRRVLRLEDTQQDPLGRELSLLYCPRRETTYKVVSVLPDEQRAAEIQAELERILSGGGT